ncbi:MAG TPA: hypothetical protein VMV49_08340 [Candidatus Deferrimicrobium sp.]|nr:hypothetical protein [Candidatus Deferrimicrobium sp.]
MGTIKSFKKVLREHGFYMVKSGKDIQFIKHDSKLGGVYADVSEETVIKVKDADFTRTFQCRNDLNSFLKNLEQNANFVSPKLVQILERDQIKALLEKITPQN